MGIGEPAFGDAVCTCPQKLLTDKTETHPGADRWSWKSLSVPLCLIGREALPVSINEMDMPAVTDVSLHALSALQHHWLVMITSLWS